jgi:MFS family permease
MRIPKKENVNDNQFLRIEKIKGLLHKHSNGYFILFFFIYDFVVGTVSFYMIPLMRNDFGYDPFNSMIIQLIIFAPQLIGAPYWGRKADRKFQREPEGKVKTLFSVIVFGSIFSISAYSLHWFNVIIFVFFLMVFTFITSSSTSIAYSILGDINTAKLRTTIFSLVNLSSIGGRSIGIALCGVLYETLKVNYSTIFLLWQIVFMLGLTLSLVVPKKVVPSELIEKRIKDIEIEETPQSASLYDVLNMLLENQKKLAIALKNITEKQFYLTKFVYYSLELIKRTLNRPNHPQNEEQNSVEPIKVRI